MTFKPNDSAWTTKGATLSDKSAEKEFGLTFDEIVGVWLKQFDGIRKRS
jgi:hypothetical protein